MSKINYRIDWIDISKGMAILLVLLGHAVRDDMRLISPGLDLTYRLIYIFHMSFFFFISGYVYKMNEVRFKKNKGSGFLKGRLKKLFLPWVIYGIFIYAVFAAAMYMPRISEILLSSGYGFVSVWEYALKAFQADNPFAYHLWFIYILFIVSVIVFIADCLTSRKTQKPVLAALALLSVLALIPLNLYEEDFGSYRRLLNYIALYLPYYILGILLYGVNIPKALKYLWYALGLGYIVIRAVFFSGFSGNAVEASSIELKLLIQIAAYAFLPGAMLLLCDISEKLTKIKPVKKILSYLGRKSFLIYLIHQPFFCAFLSLVLYSKLNLPMGVSIICCIAASLFAAFVLDFLWSKVPKGRFERS